jgi:hypothetical protein
MAGKRDDPDPWKRDVKKRAVLPPGTSSKSRTGGSSAKAGRYVDRDTAPGTNQSSTTATPKKGKKAMANNDEDRYVVKHEDGWAVKKENADRASGVFRTQKEAIDRAREIVEKSGGGRGEIRIQGRDGNFRDSDSGSRNETNAKDKK